jgi:hypothetical protein
MSSPSNSGRITPINSKQIFIEDQDFLTSTSPQNYSFLLNSNKNVKKNNFLKILSSNSDYIIRQCQENNHCTKVTNTSIIREALANRMGSQNKKDDFVSLNKSIQS